MNHKIEDLINNINKVIAGKSKIIEKIIICMICKGHVLLEDVPGVGKTTIVHTLAKSMNLKFNRIQFTPDLLPSDIIGITIYNQKNGEFQFNKGPVFSNIVLGDEINRTSPRTQSSLLEAMQETQVTTDGNEYKLPIPFIVLATQNPIEYEGTFPLPEAQLDRFMMKLSIGYPSKFSEKMILRRFNGKNPLDEIHSVVNKIDIIDMQNDVDKVYVHDIIEDYILDIVAKTRKNNNIRLGVSPRGTLALFKAVQGNAYLNGRNYVIPDDVKSLIMPVFAHRIILKPEAKLQGIDSEIVLEEIIKNIKVPVVKNNV